MEDQWSKWVMTWFDQEGGSWEIIMDRDEICRELFSLADIDKDGIIWRYDNVLPYPKRYWKGVNIAFAKSSRGTPGYPMEGSCWNREYPLYPPL